MAAVGRASDDRTGPSAASHAVTMRRRMTRNATANAAIASRQDTTTIMTLVLSTVVCSEPEATGPTLLATSSAPLLLLPDDCAESSETSTTVGAVGVGVAAGGAATAGVTVVVGMAVSVREAVRDGERDVDHVRVGDRVVDGGSGETDAVQLREGVGRRSVPRSTVYRMLGRSSGMEHAPE